MLPMQSNYSHNHSTEDTVLMFLFFKIFSKTIDIIMPLPHLTVEIISSSVFSTLNYWYVNRYTVELAEVLEAGRDIMQNVALPIWKRFAVEFNER